MPKPIVAYIESAIDYTDDNPYRDALSYMLREHHGCEVIPYDSDYEFKDDLRRLKKLAAWNLLALVIVNQEEYLDRHRNVIRLVRSRISATIPIVVIPSYHAERPFVPNPAHSIYGFSYFDAGLLEFVKRVVADWKSPDWLGAETPLDQGILWEQLRHAYETHYLDGEAGEDMLGTPDPNHQVVAEALRIRLLPSMFLKTEFDDTLESAPPVFASSAPSLYEREAERLRALSEEERRGIEDQMLTAAGYTRAHGGGFFKTRATLGNSINGFAIDALTGVK